MTPVPQSRASEAAVPVRLWRCPECRAEAFWPAEPLLPGGPALCGHPSSGYVSALYVPAVLTEERVESFAKFLAADDDPRSIPLWEKNKTKRMEFIRNQYRAKAKLYLQVAGFVSEPSTGGE